MANYLDIRLKSERLILRPLQLNDVNDILVNFTGEITCYMYPSAPKSQQDIRNYVILSRSQMFKQTDLIMAITKNNMSNEFLGVGAIHSTNSNNPELGIWLKKSAHGNKYGVEAIKLLKEWAEINLSYKYLKYPVAKDNIASRKIAEDLKGIIEDQYSKKRENGTILDEVEYRIYHNF